MSHAVHHRNSGRSQAKRCVTRFRLSYKLELHTRDERRRMSVLNSGARRRHPFGTRYPGRARMTAPLRVVRIMTLRNLPSLTTFVG